MPLLSLVLDQQKALAVHPEAGDTHSVGQDGSGTDSRTHKELHKSVYGGGGGTGAGSGNSTSGSNTCDAAHLDDSIPKMAHSQADQKKQLEDGLQLPPHVSKSKNAKFHKLFKNVPIDEYPIDSYSCAFKGDILLQGMMYVSPNWICFYSKIRARGRLVEIPLDKVISITREKMALFIPNAVGIQTADQKYVFGSFMSRDNTYKLLVTLWKHSQDSATSAGRRSLVQSREDDMTNCADISGESDTSEDDIQNNDFMVDTASPQITGPSRLQNGSGHHVGDRKISEPSCLPNEKVPGLFSLRCVDCRRLFAALSVFSMKIQKVPRTNLLLAVCSVLVVFLMLSAMGLTYKILLLQTRLEMGQLWTPAKQHSFREETMGSIYLLQSQTHMATVHQLHEVLKANIELLEQVHQSLKSLQGPPLEQECPHPK